MHERPGKPPLIDTISGTGCQACRCYPDLCICGEPHPLPRLVAKLVIASTDPAAFESAKDEIRRAVGSF